MNEFVYKMREKYDEDTSKRIKNYWNLKKKIEKCKSTIEFIKDCLNNETMPNFSRLCLANNELNNNKPFIKYIRSQITNRELDNKFRRLNELKKQEKRVEKSIKKSKINDDDWALMVHQVEISSKNLNNIQKKKHNKKLQKLGVNKKIEIDSQFINKSRNKIDKSENIESKTSVFNLSSRVLTDIEEKVLSKGLKYGIVNKKVETYEILARFEQLAQSLERLEISSERDERKADLNTKDSFLQKLQSMAFEFVDLSKKARDNLSIEEHEALENLAKDKSIVITKADKGNAVVIQDLSSYRDKISELLKKDNKFIKLEKGDPT